MEKPLYQSKTFWGVVLASIGSVGAYLLGTSTLQDVVVQLGALLALFGVRDAL